MNYYGLKFVKFKRKKYFLKDNYFLESPGNNLTLVRWSKEKNEWGGPLVEEELFWYHDWYQHENNQDWKILINTIKKMTR